MFYFWCFVSIYLFIYLSILSLLPQRFYTFVEGKSHNLLWSIVGSMIAADVCILLRSLKYCHNFEFHAYYPHACQIDIQSFLRIAVLLFFFYKLGIFFPYIFVFYSFFYRICFRFFFYRFFYYISVMIPVLLWRENLNTCREAQSNPSSPLIHI